MATTDSKGTSSSSSLSSSSSSSPLFAESEKPLYEKGGGGSKKKTIYLVRHAESEENRRLGGLKAMGSSLRGFSLPKSQDIGLSLQLLNFPAQIDSSVSEKGRSQISSVAEQLRADQFWETHNIQLVAYSPLQRARDTAAGLLITNSAATASAAASGNSDKDGSSSTSPEKDTTTTATSEKIGLSSVQLQRAPQPVRVIEVEELWEKTPAEWIPGNLASLYRRISALETWLSEQSESAIVCVGHSQFFKAMLHLDFKFRNCDVWQVELDISQRNQDTTTTATTKTKNDGDCEYYPNLPPQWSKLKRLYRVRSLSEETSSTTTTTTVTSEETTETATEGDDTTRTEPPSKMEINSDDTATKTDL